MAAKATTREQAEMFHRAQIGHPGCFDGCCLHEALTRAEEAEAKLERCEQREAGNEFCEAHENGARLCQKAWDESW